MSCSCECITAVRPEGPHVLEGVVRPCSMHRRFADEEIRIAMKAEREIFGPWRARPLDDPGFVEFPQ